MRNRRKSLTPFFGSAARLRVISRVKRSRSESDTRSASTKAPIVQNAVLTDKTCQPQGPTLAASPPADKQRCRGSNDCPFTCPATAPRVGVRANDLHALRPREKKEI